MMKHYRIGHVFAHKLAIRRFSQGQSVLTLEEFKAELAKGVELDVDLMSSSEIYAYHLDLYRRYQEVLAQQEVLRAEEKRHRELGQ